MRSSKQFALLLSAKFQCIQGQVAQLVEQRTENPRVGGSIPSLATIKNPRPARDFYFLEWQAF
jgi:hypothetical protein